MHLSKQNANMFVVFFFLSFFACGSFVIISEIDTQLNLQLT